MPKARPKEKPEGDKKGATGGRSRSPHDWRGPVPSPKARHRSRSIQRSRRPEPKPERKAPKEEEKTSRRRVPPRSPSPIVSAAQPKPKSAGRRPEVTLPRGAGKAERLASHAEHLKALQRARVQAVRTPPPPPARVVRSRTPPRLLEEADDDASYTYSRSESSSRPESIIEDAKPRATLTRRAGPGGGRSPSPEGFVEDGNGRGRGHEEWRFDRSPSGEPLSDGDRYRDRDDITSGGGGWKGSGPIWHGAWPDKGKGRGLSWDNRDRGKGRGYDRWNRDDDYDGRGGRRDGYAKGKSKGNPNRGSGNRIGRVHVAGLPGDCSQAEVKDMFEPYGRVLGLQMLGKGSMQVCAIVRYDRPQAAEAAIEGLNGKDGLTIKLARPNPRWDE
mmetsp:Transcript_101555/g.262485  ORF Transcript_101555/g.262485 Transcript_101555/m.262485 type:complete len:387 (+) Transcript_101555:137-1297(+)